MSFSVSSSRLAVLNEIALALSGELDRRRLFEGIVQGAKRLLTVPYAAVMSWDPGRGELVTEAVAGDLPQHLALPLGDLPLPIARAFSERNTVAVDDFDAHSRSARFAGDRRLGAAAAVPLLRQGVPAGVLFVAHARVDPPPDIGSPPRLHGDDLRLLEVLAGHVALALANAETIAGAMRRLARAEELQAAFRSIIEGRERDTIVSRTLDCATTILGADRAAVYLLDGETLVFAAGRRVSRHYLEAVGRLYRRSVGGVALIARVPVYVANMQTDPRTRVLHDVLADEGIRSSLIVPLLYRDELLGAVALYHDLVWPYEPDDVTPVRTLADHVALAIADARLAARTERQLAELRVLDAVLRGLSEPIGETERQRRAVQALVSGGAAERAWVMRVDADGEMAPQASAGRSHAGDADAIEAARAALTAHDVIAHGDGLLATPVLFDEELLGALVVAPSRPARPEPRHGTVQLVYAGGERGLAGDGRHEFVRTVAAQLAHGIAHARLLADATLASGRLSAVLSCIPDGLLVYDNNDRIVFANQRYLAVYGLSGQDITGWDAGQLIEATRHCFKDPGTTAVLTRIISDHESEGLERVQFEVIHPRRRLVERVRALVKMADGTLLGQVILYRDLLDDGVPSAVAPTRTRTRRRK